MDRYFIYLSIILFFGLYGILVLTLYLSRKSRKIKKYRSPFSDKFLRSPGESINRKVTEITDRVAENLVMLIAMPILFYAICISSLYFGSSKLSTSTFMVIVMAGIGLIAYHLFKLIRLLDLRHSYQLAYEGEIAVGQELNKLIRDGYYVYHDFPAGDFNIDHVVVGVYGVFAVETKVRLKPASKDRKADVKVKHDGKCLRFPNGADVESIEQAKRQAEWLSKWLRNAVGEAVRVRPVLALPGWFVERVASGGISAINPKQFRSIAKPIAGYLLSESMIKRIVHQLEQKYRDVEPK